MSPGYCELHRHLEGSIRPETIFQLRCRNPRLAKLSLPQIHREMIIPDRARDLPDFISRLGTPYMKAVTAAPEDSYQFAWQAIEDAVQDGINSLELRFCPPNFPNADHIQALYDARKKAEQDFEIKVGYVLCLLRNYTFEVNLKLARQAIQDFHRGEIVGADLAGVEAGYPSKQYQEIFNLLHTAGLPITVHAGEDSGPENIADAVNILHASRIGHAVSAPESGEVMKLLADKQILIECCVTSNYQTRAIKSFGRHPLIQFIEAGIPIAICTDDPITSGITLSAEIKHCQQEFHLSDAQLATILQDAHKFTFGR